MPTVTGSDVLAPGEDLHVIVPGEGVATAVEAVSPRVTAHVVDLAAGPPSGEAAAAQVLVPGSVPPDQALRGLTGLRLVQLLSAGAERWVGSVPDGVVLCNARGAHTPATAEWVVAAILAAQRGLPFFATEQAAGRWSTRTFASAIGARVLVVGAGDIGRRVGRMLEGFDVELGYVARTPRDGVHATAELPQLLPDADVVVILVPVTDETKGLVDAGFLAAMKDGALLVNAARGVVVDTDALLAELQSGRLRAALDVTEPEPLPEGHPLWGAPGLLLTPHVGGNVPQSGARATAALVEQIERILAGEPLANVVATY